MKKRKHGTEPSAAFVVEIGPAWRRWARHRTESDLEEIKRPLEDLKAGFGKPHLHAGLGLRRLTSFLFEFRISRDLRVVFALIKPKTFRLAMTGSQGKCQF